MRPSTVGPEPKCVGAPGQTPGAWGPSILAAAALSGVQFDPVDLLERCDVPRAGLQLPHDLPEKLAGRVGVGRVAASALIGRFGSVDWLAAQAGSLTLSLRV